MYNGECPMQRWFTNLPSNFGMMEGDLIATYNKAWQKAGSPSGIRENDHDYNTLLGQGNTLGFLAAELYVNELPTYGSPGLFSATQKLPAVVRISDFGSDTLTFRLARMAVKIPFPSAWGGEVNLLLTGDLDDFFFHSYAGVAALAQDNTDGTAKRFENDIAFLWESAVVGIEHAQALLGGMNTEALAKAYYSELPYMLGDNHAMKFQLIPKQKTCSASNVDTDCCLPATHMPSWKEAPTWAKERSKIVSAYLEKCDAVFDLQLQVKSFKGNEVSILQESGARWAEAPITAGTLVIPKKSSLSDWAVDAKLQAAIASELNVEAEGIDKMFAFHPISTHHDNRPAGVVNSFRSALYSQNAASRFETIHRGAFKNMSGSALKGAQQMPFSALQREGVFGKLQDSPVVV
jgi:hypothetical protein